MNQNERMFSIDLQRIDLKEFNHKGKVLDTLLVSKLKYTNLVLIDSNNSKLPPKLRGSHSLKAWGYRLGNYKEVHEDLVTYQPETHAPSPFKHWREDPVPLHAPGIEHFCVIIPQALVQSVVT